MIIQFFKSNRLITFLSLFVVVLLMWSFALFSDGPSSPSVYMPLYELLLQCTWKIRAIQLLIALVLVVVGAKMANDIVGNYEILNTHTYLPALFYVVLMSSHPSWLDLHPVLVANVLLLLAINKLFSTYHKDYILFDLFDSGLIIAVASLFYFPAIVFFFLIIVVLVVFRTFNLREWIVPFVGLTVPYLLISTYYFWYDNLYGFWNDTILLPVINSEHLYSPSIAIYVMIGLALFITFLSFNHLMKGLSINKVRTKKSIIVIIWFFVFSLLSFILAPSYSIYHFAFLVIPLSIYFANYFLMTQKRWWAELLFILLIATIVFNQIVAIL